MINVTALTKLLTENADGKVFQRWFITTPNGSLVAYTSPTDIRALRDQAALVLITWREQIDALVAESSNNDATIEDASPSESRAWTGPDIHTMTMEFDNRNVLVRQLQPKLLLVLEGGVPPGRSRKLQVTIEGADGVKRSAGEIPNGNPEVGDANADPRPSSSPTSHSEASTTISTRRRRTNILDIHRRKLDAMADIIGKEFDQANFSMPVDLEDRFF
ncbi:hypothetical protein ANO11243_003800 [Dothideomycetidae sp. 11243]|nr:hypothetical protein ANO11243_003800 [fungal sp. No.11243]